MTVREAPTVPYSNALELQHLALEVRAEAVEFFGFVEPQASEFDLMCGEVSLRLYEKIHQASAKCSIGVLKFNDGPFHDVVFCGNFLVDASITQFYVEKWRHLVRFESPPRQFVFQIPNIEAQSPFDALAPMDLAEYPLGQVSGAGRLRSTRPLFDCYRDRASLFMGYPSRFFTQTSFDTAAVWKMAQSSVVEFRTCAAACIASCDAAGGRQLFQMLRNDDSRLVLDVLVSGLKRWDLKELGTELITQLATTSDTNTPVQKLCSKRKTEIVVPYSRPLRSLSFMDKQIFRIQHQRCAGNSPLVLLQNRLIEAETAEQALRTMKIADDAVVVVRDNNMASAERNLKANYELWTAEVHEE
jgi:hypothetical protein